MPNQYSQDDDGLQHALGVQQELDEIIASPAKVIEHLNRTQALMSESGGDFDATVLRRAMHLIERAAPAEWRPIESCPDEVRQAILFWPAYKINDDGYTTDEPYTFTDGSRGLVGRGVREKHHGWDSAEHEVEANGAWFDDDFGFGPPTHWMPLPNEPA